MNLDFLRDPEWPSLNPEVKKAAFDIAFEDEVMSDPEWKTLDPKVQAEARKIFLEDVAAEEQKIAFENAPEKRSMLGSLASGAARGVVNVAGKAGQILELADLTPREADKEEGILDTAGRGIVDWSKKVQQEYDFLKQDKSELAGEQGFVRRGVVGIAENIPQSLPIMATAFGGAKAGAAIAAPFGAAGGPAGMAAAAGTGAVIGGVAGAITGLVAFFGAGTYGEEYTSAYEELAKTRPEATEEERQEVAHRVAFKSAAFEVGTEIPGILLGLRMVGGAKVLTQPFKATLQNVLTKPTGQFAKEFGVAAAGEVGGEMVAAAGQAQARIEEGLSGPTIPEAVAESIIPSIGMSLFFGGAAAGYNSVQTRSMMKKLNSDNIKERQDAVDIMTYRLSENTQDKALALSWRNEAEKAIQAGEKFNFDEKVINFAKIKAAEGFKEPESPLLYPEDYERINQAQDLKEALTEFNRIVVAPEKTAEDITIETLKRIRETKDEGLTLNEAAKLDPVSAQRIYTEEKMDLFPGQQVEYFGKRGTFQRVILNEPQEDGTWKAKAIGDNSDIIVRPDRAQPVETLESGRQIEYQTKKGTLLGTLIEPVDKEKTQWMAKRLDNGAPFKANIENIKPIALEGERFTREEPVKPEEAIVEPAAVDQAPVEQPRVVEQLKAQIDAQANEAAASPKNDLTEPTPDQARAGNYKKAHLKGDLVNLSGLDITIENPEGSTRSQTKPKDATEDWEPAWSRPVQGGHYGYFKRTEGKDGDQVDVFVGPNPESKTAFIIDQINPETGKFDEHKTLVGYSNKEEAKKAYLSNHEEGWQGLGEITEVPIDQFKEWVSNGKRKTEPVSYGKESPELDLTKTEWKSQKKMGMSFYVTPLGKDKVIIKENPTKGKNRYTVYKESDGPTKNIGKTETIEEAKTLADTIIPKTIQPVSQIQASARAEVAVANEQVSAEGGQTAQPTPAIFNKFRKSITDHNDQLEKVVSLPKHYFEQAKAKIGGAFVNKPVKAGLNDWQKPFDKVKDKTVYQKALNQGLPVSRESIEAAGLQDHPVVKLNEDLADKRISNVEHHAAVQALKAARYHGADVEIQFDFESSMDERGTMPLVLDIRTDESSGTKYLKDTLHWTDEEIKDARAEGTEIRIRGEYLDKGFARRALPDYRKGLPDRGIIRYYVGARPYEIFHELFHHLEKEGKVRPRKTDESERLATRFGLAAEEAWQTGGLKEFIDGVIKEENREQGRVSGENENIEIPGEGAGTFSTGTKVGRVRGDDVSTPSENYPEASRGKGNPWIRLSKDATNKGRTLLVQFTTKLMGEPTVDQSTEYYDSLYSGTRKGYERLPDFWEIPQWIAMIANTVPNSDVYVVRDMNEAKKFVKESGYDNVAFSSLDVTRDLIKELAPSFPGEVIIGGYADPKAFKDLEHTWFNSIEDMANSLGETYTQGSDYRHFKGSKVIPRLTMSQGCKYKCAFCTVPKKLDVSSKEFIDQQVESFKDLDAKLIYLNDKTFGQAGNYQYLSEVNKRVKEQNPNFEGFIIQTTASDLNRMPTEWLKESGIKYVELGVESYNDLILKGLHKPHNTRIIDLATNKLRDMKINLVPNIIIGIPEETNETYDNTFDYLKRNEDIISHANIYNLAIYEGTELESKIEVKRAEDQDENVAVKSFHKDQQIHDKFAEQIFNLMKDRISAPAAYSARPVFYSQMERVIEKNLPNKGSSGQFRMMLASWANKGEFKQDELKWSGVDTWLSEQEGKVDKQDVLNYLKENNVQIQEVTKGQDDITLEKRHDADEKATIWSWSDIPYEIRQYDGDKAYAMYENGEYVDGYYFTDLSEATDVLKKRINEDYRHISKDETKFGAYQLPGGEHYREVLLTLPEMTTGGKGAWIATNPRTEEVRQVDNYGEMRNLRQEGWFIEEDQNAKVKAYRSPHWDEPNVVAHTRLADYTDENGESVLLMLDNQSDWHQEGRKKGYRTETPPPTFNDIEIKFVEGENYTGPEGRYPGYWESTDKRDGKMLTRHPGRMSEKAVMEEALFYANDKHERAKIEGVPQGPFSKTWHEMVMKRMLRHAAENDYKKLAWVTGEQAADMFDLSKQVTSLTVTNRGDGFYIVQGILKDTVERLNTTVPEAKLADTIGKELAEKASMEKVGKSSVFTGPDLKVGGEGMKVFYDQMIPAFMNKYLKKWGTKVQDTKINASEDKYAGMADFVKQHKKMYPEATESEILKAYEKHKGQVVHSVTITPEMKESVMQGQPMFSARTEIKGIISDAKKNGTYLKAPNGADTLLDKDLWAIVRTANFKNWFGDWEKGNIWGRDDVSKVVDVNGEPLVVYHGTQKGGFTVFDPNERDSHETPSTFFTDARGMAATYSGSRYDIDLPSPKTRKDLEDMGWTFNKEDGNVYAYYNGDEVIEGKNISDAVSQAIKYPIPAGEERGVYPVFLNIRNPNESYFEGANWDGSRDGQYMVLNEENDPQNINGKFYVTREEAEAYAEENGGEAEPAWDMGETTNSVVREGKKYGNDGAIIRNVTDSGGKLDHYEPADVFVIFNSNQAKSTENTGEFNPKEEDIRYSVDGVPKELKGKKVKLTHWSNVKGLKKADPKYFGTGSAGAERMRYGEFYTPVTYFGIPPYKQEAWVTGAITYIAEVDGDKLYDIQNDPLNLWPTETQLKRFDVAPYDKRTRVNLYERNIKNKGFDGYFAREHNVVAMFKPVPVKPSEPTNEALYSAAAWHGSPYTFDKFSKEKIGTGEGAQAYGHGLYFAGKKEVAEYYKNVLSKSVSEQPTQIKWVSYADDMSEFQQYEFTLYGKNGKELGSWYKSDSDELEKIIGEENAQIIYTKEENGIFDGYLDNPAEIPLKQGRLYQVELAPDEDEYLLWDKPLSEQSEKVKAALDDAKIKAAITRYKNVGSSVETAQDIYHALSYKIGEDYFRESNGVIRDEPDDKAASDYLHSLGIRGIKYLDGSSRGKGEGDYNYVIFSDEDVEIKERFSVRTPEFKAWFGDSKVVDENGKPLVVYHGTANQFNAFDRGPEGAMFFTDKKPLATSYAKDAEYNAYFSSQKARVIPAYLSIQNPMLVDGRNKSYDAGMRNGELIDQALNGNYDGVILQNTRDNIDIGDRSRNTVYIAFSPSQIKSVNNRGTWDKENPDIRYSVRLTNKRSLGARILAGMEKPPLKVGPLVAQIADYLSTQSAKEGVIDHRTAGPKENKQVEKALVDMIEASIMKHPESIGWYRGDIQRTMSILEEIYPDLKKPSDNFWMRLAIALTSDGNKTMKNVELADIAYRARKSTGSLVTPIDAKRGNAIMGNLRFAEAVRKTFKSDKEFEKWLLGKAPVREIASDLSEKLGLTREEAATILSGENLDSVVPRAVIFGPKVGAFFANLSGDFSPVTMDMWFMRTMGRIQGNLMEGGSPGEVAQERDRLRKAIESSPQGMRFVNREPSLFGLDDAELDKIAKDISKKSIDETFRNRLSSLKGGNELRLAANARERHLKGGTPIDAPSSGAHRKWLRDRVNAAREALNSKYENADIQATIWIGEKEIYNAFGSRPTKGDYFSDGANALYEKLHGRPSELYAGAAGQVARSGRPSDTQGALFSARANVSEFLDVIRDNPDGFTINVTDGTLETSGWVVAPSKLTETYVDTITEDEVRNFLYRFRVVFENDDRAFLGGWFNKERGQFALDVAYKVEDKETATYLAELGEQDAIFHLDDHTEHKTRDAVREIRESGVYSESKRDALRGVRERLNKIIKGEGPDQRLSARTDEPVVFKDTLKPVTDEDFLENRRIMAEGRKIFGPAAKEAKKDVLSEVSRLLAPISTRARYISPEIAERLRNLDRKTNTSINDYANMVIPLLKKARKMNREDSYDWDYARKNSNTEKINYLVKKYDMQEEYAQAREMFDKLREEAIDVGLDIGEIEEYWTRIVKDLPGLYAEMNREERGVFTKALEEKAASLGLSVEELDPDMRATIVTNVIFGGPSGPGGAKLTKQRSFRQVPPRLNKYYMHSDEAAMHHIQAMVTAIEKRKFFGKIPERVAETRRQLYAAQAKVREWESNVVKAATATEANKAKWKLQQWDGEVRLLEGQIFLYAHQRDYKDNIGAFIDEFISKNDISPEHENELKEILEARFHERGTHGFWSLYKNFSYMDTMGSVVSALTQIGDVAWAMYEAGIIKGLKHAGRAAIGKSIIKREDVGITTASEEFMDPSKLGGAVQWVFKWTGLTKMDAIGKEALLNATLEKYQIEARKNPEALAKKISHIFGEETQETIQALQDGEITDNVKMLVYSRLADFQPVGLSEMPQRYLTSGNGRVFYMLKTFTIKQFDAFRNEAIHKITHGDRAEKIQGLKNLVKLAMFFVLANATADELKDLILGRKTDFSDRVADNILRLAGSSKFVTWTARTEGVGSAFAKQILPPFKFIDSLSKDVIKAGDDKGLEVVGSIPLVGKLAYWHMGRGTSKRKDIWDIRWAKHKSEFTEVHEKYEKAQNKEQFLREHKDEIVEYHRMNRVQGRLNSFRKIINQLKSRPDQTDSIKKRIEQLETRRTEMIKTYLERSTE